MSARFDAFIPFVFRWEGDRYENDPDDPGGETKFGIDKRSHPDVDIPALTRTQAALIYYADYWKAMQCDELPAKIGEAVMDAAVNCGKSRSARWLQHAAGVNADGAIGPITRQAVQLGNRDDDDSLLTQREAHYRGIARGRLAKYLRGWLNRLEDLRRTLEAA